MKYIAQTIADASHYTKDKLEFDYLKPKDFDALKETDGDIKSIGYIKFKETNDNSVDTVEIESNYCTFKYELLKDKAPKAKGYIKVGDKEYVAFTKGGLLIPILIALGVIVIIGGVVVFLNKGNGEDDVAANPVNDSVNLEFENGSDWDGSMPQNGEQSQASAESIEIPGYANLYVSTSNPEIQLINPEGNTVYFIYTIMNGDETLYETKAIEPNKMVSLNIKDLLDVGEYNLSFVISTYDVETQTPCNGATQEVTVTVRE